MTVTAVACAQCGLPAPAPTDSGPSFCCEGCRLAHALANGLELADGSDAALAYPFDDPAFLAELGGGPGPHYALAFRLEAMHCPSCIRVIESVCQAFPGVSDAKIQFTARKLSLTWDQAATPLGTIARKLAGLGYPLSPIVESDATRRRRVERRAWALRLAVAAFGAVSAGFLGEALTWGTWESATDPGWRLLAWLSLIISTPVLFYTAAPFLRGAWLGLRHGVLGMDLTIALGAVATYLASLWAVVQGGGHLYFDSLTMFLLLIVAGRWAESWAQERAADAADRLLPPPASRARVWRDGTWNEVPASQIAIGDRVAVGAGDLCPVDGTVIAGQAEIDESLLTGESRPVLRQEGDPAYGGALVVDGAIEVRADKVGTATTVARLRQMAEQAGSTHSPMNRIAERAAHWLILTIIAAAIGTAWYWSADPDKALTYAVAVLIISCPCALGLATPAALSLAAANAWRLGVLVKDGGAFEKLGRLTHLVFDKTGTVTTGEVAVERIIPVEGCTVDEVLHWAVPVAARSSHPLARALTAANSAAGMAGNDRPIPTKSTVPPERGDHRGVLSGGIAPQWSTSKNGTPPGSWKSVPGAGIQGEVDGSLIQIGRASWLAETGVVLPPDLVAAAETAAAQGQSVTWMGRDRRAVGLAIFSTSLRADAADTVAVLAAKGINVSLLSGDRQAAVAALAARIGCVEAKGDVRPDGKLQAIESLRGPGRTVGMVGDGVNDGPALAAADVGIAIGQGSGLAIEAAPVVLLGHRLAPLADVLALATKTYRIIRQNLAISVLYNVVAIPLAMAGYVTPAVAAVLMPLSSLLVLANAARLTRGNGPWKSSA